MMSSPAKHLALYKVAEPDRALSRSEKLSAALLIIAANDATYRKYG